MRKYLACLIILLFMIVISCKTGNNENPQPQPGETKFEWVINAGGGSHDTAYSMATDSSGNIYITGFFEGNATFGNTALSTSGTASDIFIAKFDSSGNLMWVKRAGGSNYDEGTAITVDDSGNLFLTGYFIGTATFENTALTSFGDRDIFIARYDSSGNLAWVKQAGSTGEDEGNSITTDSAGNLLVTGAFTGSAAFANTVITSNGFSDIFIAKYDVTGNLVWVKRAGSTAFDRGFSISASNNDFYITGYYGDTADFDNTTLPTNGDRDVFLAKYNANGNLVWARHGGGSYWDYGYSTAADNSGNVYVTGFFYESATFEGTTLSGGIQNDIFIAKYDGSGNLLWIRQAGGSSYDRGKCIIPDNAGYVYLTGHFKTGTTFENTSLTAYGDYDIFVAKYSDNGSLVWLKQAGGDDYDEGCAITLVNNGNILVAGCCSCYLSPAWFDDISFVSSQYCDIFIGKIA
ncbi:MAG: hypothetical protein GY757_08645, partial [bacterium]|nr:hypothetical protein [bacterium]